MLVSDVIPHYINGVSQQAPWQRLSSQLSVQDNFIPDIVYGLKRRPPLEYIAKIYDGQMGTVGIHTINRDTSERYVLVMGNGYLKVYDTATGSEKTVTYTASASYLSTATPRDTLKAITVADFTYIVNTTKVTETETTLSPARPFEAIIYVRQGNYGKKYQVTYKGGTVFFETPDGSDVTQSPQVSTAYIAGQLITKLQTAHGSDTFTLYGSTIYVESAADFTIETDDGFGNSAMKAIKDTVQEFTSLPARAKVGFVIEVAGDPTNDFDNYYVVHESEGVWKETIKPNLLTSLKATTMPHILVREATGNFTFKVAPWLTRLVGDDNSVPMPSLVGNTINDVFFFKNRLGVLSDENIILSESGSFYNFFAKSATTTLSGDPIDVGTSHTKVSILRHAVPFNKVLTVFSDETQFRLNATDLLSAETISRDVTTEYACSPTVKPVGVGKSIYFINEDAKSTGVMEYFVEETGETRDPVDVTDHVPTYVPKGVFKITANQRVQTFCAISDLSPNVIHVYNYYWTGNNKVQSAWGRWVLPDTDTILNIDFLDSTLFVVTQRADGVFLDKFRMSPEETDSAVGYLVHLDHKITNAQCNVVYNSFDEETIWNFPFAMSNVKILNVSGEVYNSTQLNTTSIRVAGDLTTASVIMGVPYTSTAELTAPYVRAVKGDREVADTTGWLHIADMGVTFRDTGYFLASVASSMGTYTYPYTGMFTGLTPINADVLHAGVFEFPVDTENNELTITLSTDSHLPCSFVSGSWSGDYVRYSKAIK